MDTPRQPPDDTDMVRSVSDMAAELQTPESSVRRFTVDEFDQMFETGILGPDERVELVEGEIIARETMNAPHASMVWRIQQHLQRALGDRAAIWAQLPVIMSGRSKPFPDFALLHLRDDLFRERLPNAADTFAVVEVSDTSLAIDRGKKLRLYAKAAISDYWIVDVKARTVEIYGEPHDLGYGQRALFRGDERVAFAAFPYIELSVDELLG